MKAEMSGVDALDATSDNTHKKNQLSGPRFG